MGDTITATVECTEKLEPQRWAKFRTTTFQPGRESGRRGRGGGDPAEVKPGR